jgi:hypothetical protein
MSKMEITGLEANFLLYCLDRYCKVDKEGNLTEAAWGYDLKDLNDLRWRLFAAHEHPEDGELVECLEVEADEDDAINDFSKEALDLYDQLTYGGKIK